MGFLFRRVARASETEIPYFELELVVEEEILEFEVSVVDVECVHVVEDIE